MAHNMPMTKEINVSGSGGEAQVLATSSEIFSGLLPAYRYPS